MHILTFDIEHWYESWKMRGLGGYEGLPDCDTALVQHVLDLLDATEQKATFFFTGRFAGEFPAIARNCMERGHEVASHSDGHSLLTRFASLRELKDDLARSVDSIAQATGKKPCGFRAPKWSVTPEMEVDVFEILAELGITYDSSFFPQRVSSGERCYTPHRLHLPSGALISEVPATALRIGPFAVPCGGAYLRLLPLFVTRAMFAQCRRRNVPGLLYAHPYDLNPSCHFVSGGGLFLKWMRTVGVKTALKKLTWLLRNIRFTRMDHWLEAHTNSLPEYTYPHRKAPAQPV